MDFIEKRRQAEREKREADAKTYRALVRKLGNGKLTAAEEAKLGGCIDALGFSNERVEADRDTVRQAVACEKVIATLPDAEAEAAAVAKDSDSLNADWQEANRHFQQRREAINARAQAAHAKVKAARDARAMLADMQKQHWQLLDAEDPNILARRKHLLPIVFTGEPRTPYAVRAFESIMQNPTAFRDEIVSTPRDCWIPAAGQTDEQLEALLALAMELVQNERKTWYILPAEDEAKVKAYQSACIFIGPAVVFDQRAGAFNYLPAPGQTPEHFADLRKQLDKQLQKQAKREERIAHGPVVSI